MRGCFCLSSLLSIQPVPAALCALCVPVALCVLIEGWVSVLSMKSTFSLIRLDRTGQSP